MRSALQRPEFAVPTCGDSAVLKYIADLAQRRAARLRPAVEPLVLPVQLRTMAQVSWPALVATVSTAIEACNAGRCVALAAHAIKRSHTIDRFMYGQLLNVAMPGGSAPAAQDEMIDATLVDAATAKPEAADARAMPPSSTGQEQQPPAVGKAARALKIARRAPSSRHAEVRSQLETLLSELGVLADEESEEEEEEEDDDEDDEQDGIVITSYEPNALPGSRKPAAAQAVSARMPVSDAAAQADVEELVRRLRYEPPGKWAVAVLDALLHSPSVRWSPDLGAKFLHLTQALPRTVTLPLEVRTFCSEVPSALLLLYFSVLCSLRCFIADVLGYRSYSRWPSCSWRAQRPTRHPCTRRCCERSTSARACWLPCRNRTRRWRCECTGSACATRPLLATLKLRASASLSCLGVAVRTACWFVSS